MKIYAEEFYRKAQNVINKKINIKESTKRKVYLAAGEIMQNSILRQFRTKGARFLGHKWAPLAESTKRQYEKKSGGKYSLEPTLNRSGGGLRDSIQTTIDSDSVTVSSNKEYAKYLQFGTRHMSPRPFLPMKPFLKQLLPQDLKRISDVASKILLNEI